MATALARIKGPLRAGWPRRLMGGLVGGLMTVATLVAVPALAQDAPDPDRSAAENPDQKPRELTGTLKKVQATGTVTIGYRESSLPFSYLDPSGHPIGYSIDLCREIVADLGRELGGRDLTIVFRPVTAESRIPAVVDGTVDLECGSTTSNTARQKQVAFSPPFFVSGTKLLVKRGSGIGSYKDLVDKAVVVTAGTTNEAALHRLLDRRMSPPKIEAAPDHAASFALLESGKVQAFATDDVLLYGLIAKPAARKTYQVVGEFLSYDPYGIMYRRDDPDLAAVINHTFRRLAESQEILQIYNTWFTRKLPSGENLDLPMGPQLEEMFRMIGLPD